MTDLGGVRAIVRPDGRCFLRVRSPDGYGPSLRAAVDALRRDLFVTVDEADAHARRELQAAGFVVHRRELELAVPTDPALTGLGAVEVPAGFAVAAADGVAATRLRRLDDALRQDVPGTAGWRWDEEGFREETFESPAFDPATYPVAVDEARGAYVGLARVWNNPSGPRLGLVAVLPEYRRRGLARALLASAFAVLHERGRPQVAADVDETNAASLALLERLGACPTGASLELVRRLER